MRLTIRLQRLERDLSPGLGGPGAQARQAWLRAQRLPADGDRPAALLAIFEQAEVPADSYRDPAWQDALGVFFAQLSLDEVRTLLAALDADLDADAPAPPAR